MLENLARLSNILGTTYEESRSYKDNDRSDKYFNNDVLISFNNDDNNNNIKKLQCNDFGNSDKKNLWRKILGEYWKGFFLNLLNHNFYVGQIYFC